MGNKKCLVRVVTALMALITVFGGLLPAIGSKAAEVIKVEKTYDIAVVYDNSGSMYLEAKEDYTEEEIASIACPARWCKAKFAMEIFASMLDYAGGDKLTIFPMWEVVTDGSTPAQTPIEDAQYGDAIEIRSKDDIDLITNMYTTFAGDTPFNAVINASNYLKTSTATEKWLIVLTDGAFSPYGNSETDAEAGGVFINCMSTEATRTLLLEQAKLGFNVQYFLMGELPHYKKDDIDYQIPVVEASPSNGLYVEQAITSEELQTKLIDICNMIFQRDELVNRLEGDQLKLDISMKKLVVFVQGEGAKIVSLKDESGERVEPTEPSKQRKYSTFHTAGPWDDYIPLYDKTLYGHVVTFGACPKGNYTLDLDGVDPDKVKIFYEPDVDMVVTVYDSEGNEVVFEEGTAVIEGEYTVKAKLIDAVTGDDITNSDL
ncbi:MAG: hypothetical protein IJD22_04755, partial [Clostridia bacterium]|nr:hypothetical protein [Clostridia bacterium]